MPESEAIARGLEIGIAVAKPLAELIAEEIIGGLDEAAATKRALERLAAQDDLEPVLPKVRAKIADARRPKSERRADDTREVPAAGTHIVVNGQPRAIDAARLTYERALELAGPRGAQPTVTWSLIGTNIGGTLRPGLSVAVTPLLVVEVADTSGA